MSPRPRTHRDLALGLVARRTMIDAINAMRDTSMRFWFTVASTICPEQSKSLVGNVRN